MQALVQGTKTTVDDKILQFMHENAVKLLADELLIEGITPDSTAEEVQAVADKIVESFGKVTDKTQLWTSISANAYRLWMDVKEGKKISFGTGAALVEGSFKSQ